MSARWATFLVWALVAASAAAWGLKLFVTAPVAPPQVAVAGQSQLPRGDITRVLGADAPPPVDPAAGETLASGPADARFQLVGVVAPRGSETARGGVALIAIDGKPAKAFRVGAVVEGENIVQAVRARGADLGPAGGKVTVALNIPPPAPAATGTLPDARSPAAAAGAVQPAQPGAARPPPPSMPAPAAPTFTAPPPAPTSGTAIPPTGARRAGAPGAAGAVPLTPVTPGAPLPAPPQPPSVQPVPGALPPGPGPVTPLPNTAGQNQPQLR